MIVKELENRELLWNLYRIQNLTQKQIAARLNCDRNLVWTALRSLGITSKAILVTDTILKDRDFLLDLYIKENLTAPKIAIKLGLELNLVNRAFKFHKIEKRKRGTDCRKYQDNIEFTKSWSNNLAYILGFFSNDGYLSPRKNPDKIAITLSHKDLCHLENIRNIISPLRNVKVFERVSFGKKRKYCYLSINSWEFCEFFVANGMTFKKQDRQNVPNIPIKYWGHFLRGCFDADGWVYVDKKRPNYPKIGLVNPSLNYIANMRELTGNIGVIASTKKNPRWYILNQEQKETFVSLIYKDAEIYLQRKRNKFIEFGLLK